MVYKRFMKIALEEAKKGCGWVNPNPMVGAVIVKDGEVIGKGYHKMYGGHHAEINALSSCTANPAGGTMYVTLEPCCHYGKTPPCTEAIIKSGIKEVVVGVKDPNELVSGRGIKRLRKSGIKVISGVLEEECIELNEVFFHFITNKTPFITMKYAMTMDGKIATDSGKSQWITGMTAREHAHYTRHANSAIMVGVGTVLADDPMLNCRLPGCKDPVRIVCDTNLSIPLESKIVKTANNITTFVATSVKSDDEKARELRQKGVFIINVSQMEGHVNLPELMEILGQKKIDSVLLEGGATLNSAALKSGIVNKVNTYIAPKIFGGEMAKSPVGGIGIDSPDEAYRLAGRKETLLGEDILLEYTLKRREPDVHWNH